MTATMLAEDWKTSLRGDLREQYSLAQLTWFKVGGPAELFFKPSDISDLQAFLQAWPEEKPVFVLGVGSNLIIRDGGMDGVVIRLGRSFTEVKIEGVRVRAGAAALDRNVALTCQQQSIAGLEFLSGIPGTIGGAVFMNAGAYGKEVKDVLLEVSYLDRQGTLHQVAASDLTMRYRHGGLPEGAIVVEAVFQAEQGNQAEIAVCMAEIQQARESTQPVKEKTGGSTFKNPDGYKAWQLVDEAGCRGLKLGDAQVSEKHCNFLINTDNATAADIEQLGETVRERVKAKSGIQLEWEIKRVGKVA